MLACVNERAAPPVTVLGDSGRGDTAAADTARPADTGRADTASSDQDGLRGVALDPALEPPVFTVFDQAGQVRTALDLVGHPTVLWFFREAEGST
jgi:hypothetical protein